MPSTSCVCLSTIIAHDIEEATHVKKTSQYFQVWAINWMSRKVEDTTDRVINNFKSLFNADGVF